MHPQYKELIIRNFSSLIKECDIKSIANCMVDKGIYTRSETSDIFSTDDERHNARMFLFSLQKKSQKAYTALIDSLIETNKKEVADLFQSQRKIPDKVIILPNYENTSSEDLSPRISRPCHVDHNTTPLSVQVKHSTKFYDLYNKDAGFEYYYSRSKKRGRLLIINNYEFGVTKMKHPTRNGAIVDNNNLQNLFQQMGGWDINLHVNKTAEEMKVLLKLFAEDKVNKQYDVCFVILMSHGNIDSKNETILYGIDDRVLYVSEVERQFNNENCKWFIAKPKILLFQACRGEDLDYTIAHYTETDSKVQGSPSTSQPTANVTNVRTQEDMLIGHSTLLGFKAHRDRYRGSWYIEILCEKFMNHAHTTPVDDLLGLVDQGLRKRMSEKRTMQTAEYSNKGFKKLYLHPGIYYENGAINKYFNLM